MTILVSVLAALIGAFAYALCTNPKLSEMGRITYFAGILAFLLHVSPTAISVFSR